MAKHLFFLWALRALLFAASAWVSLACSMTYPSAPDGITDNLYFPISWTGCVTPVTVQVLLLPGSKILAVYQGSVADLSLCVMGPGRGVYIFLTDAAGSSVTSPTYIVLPNPTDTLAIASVRIKTRGRSPPSSTSTSTSSSSSSSTSTSTSTSSSSSSSSSPPPSHSSPLSTGAIVGIVIGAVSALAAVVAILVRTVKGGGDITFNLIHCGN
ncbi:uncharacterized protein EI90DRAFT_3067802 [Cantharellus anzutake]|uniref:uncharacterized protein n=1 Tax=Cantharellus anzutake TaxID=1750568 RepID=UPI0019052B2A|nr:uncharacterized protein EI90DRAFT_3086796 [Cantharellus anzutake]XP_038913552.1 uncharacterized protein EI90DRAFT_3067802 [Cantharellus anzutake]KAF8316266.1 hypothetical protein EI90DRAFT_3086796 [Cantharellus anzutake]KAF8327444.1 hypothetical protein EI90DRAFT_3067802 [Cantharellus anzutake]